MIVKVISKNNIHNKSKSLNLYFVEIKKAVAHCATTILAGALGFEPRTNGFGDHYSTVEPYP